MVQIYYPLPLYSKTVIANEEANLAYYKIGNSNKVILCIHGLTRNNKDFLYLANALSDDYTVICVDIFGRGNSSWLQDKRQYNYKTYYNSIVEFIYEVINTTNNKINIIGTSMGGIIAMYVAAYHPDLIDKIVLNDIGVYIDLNSLKRLSHHIKRYPKFSNKHEAENYLRIFLSPLDIKKEEHWLHMINSSIRLESCGNYYLNYDPVLGQIFVESIQNMKDGMNLWHLWNHIKHPVLILRGQKSDILTLNTVEQMVSKRNNVQFIEYPGVGHVPSLMTNQHILDIRKWLSTKY